MGPMLTRRGVLASFAVSSVLPSLLPLRGMWNRAPKRMALEDRHRATLQPDRICLTVSEDPAIQPVTWRTSTEVDTPVVQVVEAPRGPIDPKSAQEWKAATVAVESALGASLRHTARIGGLTPGRLYAYRVGDGENWSEWATFRTPESQPKEYRFVYLGDSQNDILGQVTRVARAAMLDCPDAAFVAHGGDLVERGDRDDLWGEWFEAYQPWTRQTALCATPGNHDYRIPDPNNRDVRVLAEIWNQQFDFPKNGPEGLKGSVYFFDRPWVRFVSLNTMEPLEPQLRWLERVLAGNTQRWTIVMFHHPVYSSGNERDSSSRRGILEPFFSRHNVDLVLQGHDHTYARTGLVRNDRPAKDQGTVYLNSVTGPKQYRLTPAPLHRSLAAQTQLYQIVTVTADSLRVVAKTALGEVHDDFTLRKGRDGSKRLVEAFRPKVYNPAPAGTPS
ncbi:MAG: metallophosphoesterase family protein [Fimbriimonadales bacterium]|nr:metallophosphoesterase family protein [Fimbriimonadales bacterium]